MQHKANIWTGPLLLLCALALFVGVMTPVLKPKRNSYGCLWDAYLQEPEQTVDVLCIGSSVAYSNIVPALIYEDTGITAYVMAGPVQTVSESYYYLREALKTQKPKVVLLELSEMFSDRVPAYNLINIGYMPNSMNKWCAMVQTVPASEWISYVFPLYAYHDRWEELTKDDFTRAFTKASPDMLAGHTYLNAVIPLQQQNPAADDCDAARYAENESFLRKIVAYCAEEDIRLVTYFAPRQEGVSQARMERMEKTVQELHLCFENFDAQQDNYGIDTAADYYDRTHLNCHGAEKFTHFLSEYLTQTLELAPTEPDNEALWQQRIAYWYELRGVEPQSNR